MLVRRTFKSKNEPMEACRTSASDPQQTEREREREERRRKEEKRDTCVYIFISTDRQREREREKKKTHMYIYIYTHKKKRCLLLCGCLFLGASWVSPRLPGTASCQSLLVCSKGGKRQTDTMASNSYDRGLSVKVPEPKEPHTLAKGFHHLPSTEPRSCCRLI